MSRLPLKHLERSHFSSYLHLTHTAEHYHIMKMYIVSFTSKLMAAAKTLKVSCIPHRWCSRAIG